MKNAFIVLVLASELAACGSVENSRYRDTAALEKPPTLALQKTPANSVIDDSVEPKKQIGGLDEKVVLLDESPKKLVLKQSISEAWRTLGTALRQSDMKVTDYDKAKHLYYVSYKSQGVLKNILSALNEEDTKTVYLVTLSPKDGDTLIQAALANRNEQRSQNADENVSRPTDDSDGLIESLYHLLRDDVKTE
jgi:uncharacterized lipoprotein